ncbi:MAG: GWxTD domain-containing protein [Thermoanaerobaculia bacterium]
MLFSGALTAQTLPELFQQAKAQVKGEAWQDALKTLDAIDAAAGRPGNEAARQQLAAPTAFYRGVCDANLGQTEKARSDFAAFLQLEPNASMDPSMYSKQAIAAFRAAQKAAGPRPEPEGKSSVFTAFQEFRLPPNAGEPVNDTWADGPISWILSAGERRSWELLASGSERQEFVERFWEARNPRPGNPDNSYRTAFERRVAFADARFAHAEGARGSMTDRGRVFVLMGPPSYVGRRPIRPGEDTSDPIGTSRQGNYSGSEGVFVGILNGPRSSAVDSSNNWREVWHYRKELLPKGVGYQQVDIEFITRKDYGINVMQRDQTTLATLDAAKAGAAGRASEK